MELNDISNMRLLNQQLEGTKFKTVKEIVGWMGAMQAQDYNMSKWAVGIRLPGITGKKVQLAIDKGEILRTHLLRPTWHFVAAEDIYWMLELTATKILSSVKGRHKELELTPSILNKSKTIIEKALSGNKHLARIELMNELRKAKINSDGQRAAHIMFIAELDKLVCSGITKGKETTYALLSERVPFTKAIKKEEALAKLALRYFTSHGPATLQDFTWWSGLAVADARNGLEMIKKELISETIAEQTYWMSHSFSGTGKYKEQVYLIPAFDEFIISYKDRAAALAIGNYKRVISSNGIFWPTIVSNGKVIGLWKRTVKNEKVIIEPSYFKPASKREKIGLEKAAGKFGDFLDKKVEIIN